MKPRPSLSLPCVHLPFPQRSQRTFVSPSSAPSTSRTIPLTPTGASAAAAYDKPDILYDRGFWTFIVPRDPATIPKDTAYHRWFISNFWYPANGLKNWAEAFVVRSVNYHLKQKRIALKWQNYDRFKAAFRFFNSASSDQSPFQLLIDATRWPIDDPFTTQLKIHNLPSDTFHSQASYFHMKNRIRNQFPYLKDPDWRGIEVARLERPHPDDPSGWYVSFFYILQYALTIMITHREGMVLRVAIWRTTNEEVQQAISRGPIGEEEKSKWRVYANADLRRIANDVMGYAEGKKAMQEVARIARFKDGEVKMETDEGDMTQALLALFEKMRVRPRRSGEQSQPMR
ncbi:hypothetical protein BT69DRAFT_1352690 [Atractiella rhizophila]|nr:hypothetical protein BT69DRAFT_1352690 [Atractiella rhizophila]